MHGTYFHQNERLLTIFVGCHAQKPKRTKTFKVGTIGLLPTVAKHRQHFLLVSRNRIQSRRHNTCTLVNA